MNRVKRVVAATTVSAVAVSGFSLSTASADPVCLRGEVCTYRYTSMLTRHQPIPSTVCFATPQSFNRLHNNSSFSQRAWQHRNCTGTNELIEPGQTRTFHWSNGLGGY